MTNTLTLGLSRPITISLPDSYWNVLFCMAEMSGRTVEDLALERLKQIIIEDVVHSEEEEGYFGRLLVRGWKSELETDPYYQSVTGKE